jgi:hypothetical protein
MFEKNVLQLTLFFLTEHVEPVCINGSESILQTFMATYYPQTFFQEVETAKLSSPNVTERCP